MLGCGRFLFSGYCLRKRVHSPEKLLLLRKSRRIYIYCKRIHVQSERVRHRQL
jgi:hypothetical protein